MKIMIFKGRRRRLSQWQREEIAGYLFISPWIIGFLIFTIGAMIYSFGLSFFKSDMMTPAKFIGIKNYVKILNKDRLFWKALINTIYYTFVSVPLGLTFAMIVASFMNQKIKGIGIYRTIYYLPSVISGVAVALLWIWLLHPDFGLVNYMLSLIGLPKLPWLFSETWAMPAIIMMSLWRVGGSMLIFLAGLQGIPAQLYEAAELDGAGSFRKLIHITLPMLTPTIFFTFIMGIIGSFQIFTQTYIMTSGGPNNATLTYVLYLYRTAFQKFYMGYASALAWVLFVVILAVTLTVFKSSSLWVYYEGELVSRR